MEKEKQFFIKRMDELADMAQRQYRPVFTEFLNLYENSMVLSERDKLAPVSIHSWGGYEEAERRLLCFSPEDVCLLPEEFPVSCIHMMPKSRKFSDDLSHRDFLGAVLNLGIDRNRTGDILVRENDAWLFCDSGIAEFIKSHLERVKHTAIVCEEVIPGSLPPEIFRTKMQTVRRFVSSLRLDAVAAAAFHTSRSKITEYIRAEKVFINGRLAAENSIKIQENDLILVRGMGRFRYLGTEGESKKGRLAVRLEV